MIKDKNKVYWQLKVGFTKYNITSKAPYILAILCTIAQTIVSSYTYPHYKQHVTHYAQLETLGYHRPYVIIASGTIPMVLKNYLIYLFEKQVVDTYFHVADHIQHVFFPAVNMMPVGDFLGPGSWSTVDWIQLLHQFIGQHLATSNNGNAAGVKNDGWSICMENFF